MDLSINYSDPFLWDNTTDLYNISSTNATNSTTKNDHTISWVYTKGVLIITVFCIISMTVNVRVLISVRWIKGPLSTTLFISLSLAAADAFASAIFFIGIVLNSYSSEVWNYEFPSCFILVLEAFRLGAIVTTVLHLTFLAINHYLGIVRPLHYPNIMTRELTKGLLVFLWLVPPIYFLIYFACITNDGFQHKDCEATFITEFNFRIMFTLFLLVPLIAMTFIYTHILVIVRRKQNEWNFLAKREASYKHRGGTKSHLNTDKRKPQRNLHQHSHDGRCGVGTDHQRSQQRMQHNVKAVHTTLLILGSFVAGLLPPIFLYLLFCNDCLYRFAHVHPTFYWLVNLLLVTKPLANPIIYAARMQEIKKATRRMRVALCHGNGKCRFCSPLLPVCWLCCGCSRNSASNRMNGGGSRLFSRRWGGGGNTGPGGYGIDSGVDSQQLYFSGSSWRAQTPRTAVCRLVSNGNTQNTTTFGNISGSNTVTFASDVAQHSNTKQTTNVNNGDSTTVL